MSGTLRRAIRAAALASGLLALGPLAIAAPARDAPIAIAVIGPYTGGSADMGISMRQGVELATGEINRAGGVLGRRIVLVARDDEAHNERGGHIAREVTEVHPVTAGIGLINTGVALAAAPYFEQARIPLIVSVATGASIAQEFAPPEYAHNYVFRFSMSTAIEAPAIVAEALRRGYRRPGILTDATSYGLVGRGDLSDALVRAGVRPVSLEKFNIGDVDMTPQLRRARAAGADVLLTYGIGPELAAIARDRAALGWNVPLIGSWTLSMASFIKGAGPSGSGTMMTETFIDEAQTPAQAAFLKAFSARFRAPIASPMSAAQGYDSLRVLVAAIAQAGSTDGVKIRAALEQLREPVVGVVKTYNHPFSTTNHEAILASDILFGLVRDGRVVRATSPTAAAALRR
ncbi:MAG TPA: ABC transporter substrate-binding protein [Stellaceae bacterium]|nr:ABC transporter substrate-binding protein [Stellaceae bacterium]